MTTGTAFGATAKGIVIGGGAGRHGSAYCPGSGTALSNVGQIVVGGDGDGTFTVAYGAQVITSIIANPVTSRLLCCVTDHKGVMAMAEQPDNDWITQSSWTDTGNRKIPAFLAPLIPRL
jgi:T5SS/PEP-CTERM-associated repeat protein